MCKTKTKKSRSWTNGELEFEMTCLNNRFFEGKVNAKVSFAKLRPGLLGRTFHDAAGQQFIEINKAFKQFHGVARTTLLHEMAHIKLDKEGYVGYPKDNYHADRFHNEMDRLYRVGAYDGEL